MDERQLAYRVNCWAREHREELICDLKRLVSIPSVADYSDSEFPMGAQCAQALNTFLDMAKRYGLVADNDDWHTASVLLESENSACELGILGHLDVVPAGDDWKQDAFTAQTDRGILYGRGSADNKGPLVMALYVLRCIKELQLPFHSAIRLIAGCDEEREMRDINHYLLKHKQPDFSLICDGAWPLCIGEKGLVRAELRFPLRKGNLIDLKGGNVSNQIPDKAYAVVKTGVEERCFAVTGKTAHCGTPENGDNAILKLIDVLLASDTLNDVTAQLFSLIRKCFADHNGTGLRIYYADRQSGATTCVPCRIQLDDDAVNIQLDIRYPVTQNGELLIEKLQKRCSELDVNLSVLMHDQPRIASADDGIIRLLLECCKKHLSRRCKPYTTGGGTYAKHFPCSVPFGPLYLEPKNAKTSGQPHAANESVSIDQLLEGIKVYVIALARLDNYFAGNNKQFLPDCIENENMV